MPRFIKNIGPQLTAVVMWGAVALSMWYWLQKSIAVRVPATIEAQHIVPKIEASNPVAMAKFLGAGLLAPIVPSAAIAERFILSGVVASSTGQGAALISVDGALAKPFRVGAELAPGFVLVAVAPREAMLADGLNAAVQTVLSLPRRGLTQASTTLPTTNENSNAAPKFSSAVDAFSAPDKDNAAVVTLSLAPQVSEQPAVPPRADVRLQPQMSLRRDEIRTP